MDAGGIFIGAASVTGGVEPPDPKKQQDYIKEKIFMMIKRRRNAKPGVSALLPSFVLDLNFYPDLSTSTWVSTTYEECHNWFLPIISVDLPDNDVRGISHLPN